MPIGTNRLALGHCRCAIGFRDGLPIGSRLPPRRLRLGGDDDERQPPSVELAGVTKRFGDLVAVDDLSLELGSGEFFTLLGPSGCGKTTTLRMIAGFEQPSEGTIRIDGADVAGAAAAPAADQHRLPELRPLPPPERRPTTSPSG